MGRAQGAFRFEQFVADGLALITLEAVGDEGDASDDVVEGGGDGRKLGVSAHRSDLYLEGRAGLARYDGFPMPVTLQRLDLRGVSGPLLARLPRPELAGDGPIGVVKAILADVKAEGDAAVRAYTSRFDGVTLDQLRVPPEALDAALKAISAPLREALELARDAIEAYHRTQLHPEVTHEHNGVTIRELRRAVARAGLYVPGGRARYPSTVLMTAIPARVAGVAEVVLCVPPDRTARSPAVTWRPRLCRRGRGLPVGGAQAIGAMAYGTESIRPVDVIVGPGNVYVSIAKREVAQEGQVGVPSALPAPPRSWWWPTPDAPADYAAIDLMVQAEHGPDGLAWLVTWSEEVADAVDEAVTGWWPGRLARPRSRPPSARRLGGARRRPRRGDGGGQRGSLPSTSSCMIDDPDALVPLVRNAGAVFCGPCAPASVGDYVAGINHVLPTHAVGPVLERSAGRRLLQAHPRVSTSTRRPSSARPPRGRHRRRRGAGRPCRSSVAHPARVAGAVGDDASRRREPTSVCARGTTRRRSTWRCGSTPTNRRMRPRPAFVEALVAAIRAHSLSTAIPTGGLGAPRQALAELHGVRPAQVFCANGSNEVLQCLCLAYGGPGR